MSKGNFPLKLRIFRSHPFNKSFLTILEFPDMTAKWRGVIPKCCYFLSIYEPHDINAKEEFSIPL